MRSELETNDKLPVRSCPACASASSKALFTARDWAFRATNKRFEVRRCLSCGAGFVSPRPEPTEIRGFYPATYYWSFEQAGAPVDWGAIIDRRSEQLAAKADALSSQAPGRLLDLGCQKGEFVWFMRQQGWAAEGVELDRDVPNPTGQPIHYGDFLTLPLKEESFDVVTAWAVLEHVLEPQLFVHRAASLLRPGGKMIGVVTNLNSIQARVYRADDIPRHLNLFTAGSLASVATRNGLTLRRTWTDQRMFGGALNGGLVALCKRLGGYSWESVFEEWKQVHDPDLYWGAWRGNASGLVRSVSRLDRALTLIPERILDRMGFGFNLGFILEKPLRNPNPSSR